MTRERDREAERESREERERWRNFGGGDGSAAVTEAAEQLFHGDYGGGSELGSHCFYSGSFSGSGFESRWPPARHSGCCGSATISLLLFEAVQITDVTDWFQVLVRVNSVKPS